MYSSGSIEPDDPCLDEWADSIEEAVSEATRLCQRFRHCSISMQTTLDPACLDAARLGCRIERYVDPAHLVSALAKGPFKIVQTNMRNNGRVVTVRLEAESSQN